MSRPTPEFIATVIETALSKGISASVTMAQLSRFYSTEEIAAGFDSMIQSCPVDAQRTES